MPDPCAWASGDRSLVGWWSQRRRRRAWCWQRTCRDDLSDLATVAWKASQIPTSTGVPRPVVTRGLPPPPPTVFEEDCIRHLMLALLRCCCHRTGIATPIMRPPFTVFALACFFPFTSMAWAWASRATAFQSRIEKQQSSAALRDRGDCIFNNCGIYMRFVYMGDKFQSAPIYARTLRPFVVSLPMVACVLLMIQVNALLALTPFRGGPLVVPLLRVFCVCYVLLLEKDCIAAAACARAQ